MILGQSLPENRNNSDRITFQSDRITFQSDRIVFHSARIVFQIRIIATVDFG